MFAANGSDAPLEYVARRAGVGVGTLYGHFPTRRALIAALLADRNETLFAHGDRLLDETVTAVTVDMWVRAVVEHAATYRGLAAALTESLDDDGSELHESCVRMNRIGEQLVGRAARSAAIDADVTAADVFTLISAAAWIREQTSPDQANRLIGICLGGMRSQLDSTTANRDDG